MTLNIDSHSTTTAFKMTSAFYTLTTLELHVTDMRLIQEQLMKMHQKAPNFFKQTPVVIGLDYIKTSKIPIRITALKRLLQEYGLLFIAIRGGNEHDRIEASANGIAWLMAAHKPKPMNQIKKIEEESVKVVKIKRRSVNELEYNNSDIEQPHQSQLLEKKIEKPKTLIIDRPVRSGQQIYSSSDLVILGAVNTGAEVLAKGHIHIYGTLRGRALAGITGDENACIFCNKFEAELISICGQYKLPVCSNKDFWKKKVYINFFESKLCLKEF